MIGDESLEYWSRETSYSSSHCCNYDEISEETLLKCLRLMEDVNMGILIPATLPIIIA